MTDKEKNILDFLKKSISEGTFPTIREICRNTGIPSTSTVSAALTSLENQGYISIKRGKSRGICLNKESITLVPLLGDAEGERAPYPKSEAKDIFAVCATEDVGEIKKGDLVFFKKCYAAPPGTVAAFESDKGVTVGEIGKSEGALIGRMTGFTRLI